MNMEFSQKMLVSSVFEEVKGQGIKPREEKIHLAVILYSCQDDFAKLFDCDGDFFLNEESYTYKQAPSFSLIGNVQSVSIEEKMLFLTDSTAVSYQFLISVKTAINSASKESDLLQLAFESLLKNYSCKLPSPQGFTHPISPKEKHIFSIQKEDIRHIQSPPTLTFSDKSLNSHMAFALYL